MTDAQSNNILTTSENPASNQGEQGFSGVGIAAGEVGFPHGEAPGTLKPVKEASQNQDPDDSVDELASFLTLVDQDNSYQVERVLKKSDFEVTQLVSHKSEGGLFIRKYLSQDLGLGSAYERIFEVQQTGVTFAHIPRIHDCYTLNTKLVVIMEYVQGETLKEVIYRCDPSLDLALQVFPQLCEAVRELHERFDPPLIHRDLKPTNIILSYDRLTLIDFGIARTYHTHAERDTVRFGTREFAPPEQFGFGQTDVRSDIYSLGILLYYCFTEEIADSAIREQGFTNPLIPAPFQRVIARACAFDPKERFANVADLLFAFNQAKAKVCGASGTKVSGPNLVEGTIQASGSASQSANASLANMVGSLQGSLQRVRTAGDFIQRCPFALGRIWNALVLIVWTFMMAVAFYAVVLPNEQDQSLPIWFLAFEYVGIFGGLCTSWAYALLDKRRLFKRFPKMRKLTFPKRFVCFALVVPVGLVFLLLLVGIPLNLALGMPSA